MDPSKTGEATLRGASSGLRNVWPPSRPRKSVERDLERRWRPPSLMDVWRFLTEQREHQTAVRLSQDIREEKKSLPETLEIPLSMLHMSHPILFPSLCAFFHRNPAEVSLETHTLTYAAAIRLNDKAFLDRDGREEKMLRELELSRMISW